jgi:hypothetical protein
LAEKNLITVESDLNRIAIEVPNILKYKDEYLKRSGETPEQEQIQIESRGRADKTLAHADAVRVWYDDEFYPIFPRKKAKPAGLKAARSHLKTIELRTAAIDGLRRQLPELLATEPQHRPYPATWINGRRWEDEPDENKPSQRLIPLDKYQIRRNEGLEIAKELRKTNESA